MHVDLGKLFLHMYRLLIMHIYVDLDKHHIILWRCIIKNLKRIKEIIYFQQKTHNYILSNTCGKQAPLLKIFTEITIKSTVVSNQGSTKYHFKYSGIYFTFSQMMNIGVAVFYSFK